MADSRTHFTYCRIFGTNPTRLLSLQADLQPISLMPLMTAVPVTLTPMRSV